MAAAIDLNRGVMTKFHPSGITVNMYLDDPGTYYDNKGEKLPPQIAQQAGFNVERDAREKIKRQRLEEYKAKLEAEMATEEDAIAQAMTENSKYLVRHVGADQYALFDKETGNRVSRTPMSKGDVEILLGKSAIEAADEEAEAQDRIPAPFEPPLGGQVYNVTSEPTSEADAE